MTAGIGSAGCPTYRDGRCAVCSRRVSPGRLMCLPHWRRVPDGLRKRVNGALQRYWRNDCTLAELREIQDAAIASVTEPVS